MADRQPDKRIYQGVYYLSSGLIYTAIFLRCVLFYQGTQYLGTLLGLLFCFLLLFLLGSLFSIRIGKWFHLYLALQTILIFLLIFKSNHEDYDYISLLFAILGMQAMQRLDSRSGTAWICIFFIVFGVPFIYFEGTLEGLIRVVLFGSVIIFLSAYSLATRRAQEAHAQNQSLMLQLQQANQQLEAHSDTLKNLGVARERQRLRRELHDSVTQTIFSMTLTTQSALLLLDRDPTRVGIQLERLNHLAQSALAEMHTLISELKPDQHRGNGIVEELRQYISGSHIPDGLTVSLEVEGDEQLTSPEEQNLFRIAQEALNNVIKHAQATNTCLRLHLEKPLWMEIEDNGQGFSMNQVQGIGRLGLTGMRERASEINWQLLIQSIPGCGTCIRVEKKYPTGEKD